MKIILVDSNKYLDYLNQTLVEVTDKRCVQLLSVLSRLVFAPWLQMPLPQRSSVNWTSNKPYYTQILKLITKVDLNQINEITESTLMVSVDSDISIQD